MVMKLRHHFGMCLFVYQKSKKARELLANPIITAPFHFSFFEKNNVPMHTHTQKVQFE
jgi:pyridoxine/pyridoxamine 5'-phosphate oxidase